MQGKIWIIATDGTVISRDMDRQPNLDELQASVEGLIQIVPAWIQWGKQGPCVAFCNEEGLLERLPINLGATAAWRADLDRQKAEDGIDYDPDFAVLVGSVVVLTGDAEFRGED